MKNSLHNACIVSHIFATGPAQELEEYLKERTKDLLFIGHPFSFSPDIRSFYTRYRDGKVTKSHKALAWKLPDLFLYFKDLLYTVFWVFKFRAQVDLYVGFDPLNAFAGLFLKRIGKVKKTIFYTIDYVPRRFKNRGLNYLYHKIDIFCAEKSDFVWNLSQRINDARRKSGMKDVKNAFVVPIGVNYRRIRREDDKNINRTQLVYLGFLDKKRGLEFIIESMNDIIRKIPQVRLLIVGGGSQEEYFRRLSKDSGLQEYIEFKGYINDHKEVETILSRCAVGLAIYEPYEGNFTWYTDPSKPKQYMACGLPVIITGSLEISEVIEKRKMGLAIQYDKSSFINAVTLLLNDDDFYFECRKNAKDFASRIEWGGIFAKAFHDALAKN